MLWNILGLRGEAVKIIQSNVRKVTSLHQSASTENSRVKISQAFTS